MLKKRINKYSNLINKMLQNNADEFMAELDKVNQATTNDHIKRKMLRSSIYINALSNNFSYLFKQFIFTSIEKIYKLQDELNIEFKETHWDYFQKIFMDILENIVDSFNKRINEKIAQVLSTTRLDDVTDYKIENGYQLLYKNIEEVKLKSINRKEKPEAVYQRKAMIISVIALIVSTVALHETIFEIYRFLRELLIR